MCRFAVTTKTQKNVSKQQLPVLAVEVFKHRSFPGLHAHLFFFFFPFSLQTYYIFSMMYFFLIYGMLKIPEDFKSVSK